MAESSAKLRRLYALHSLRYCIWIISPWCIGLSKSLGFIAQSRAFLECGLTSASNYKRDKSMSSPISSVSHPIDKPIDVVALIDRSKFSPLQWWIMFLCFLVIAADGFDTVAVGYVGPVLAAKWGVSKIALGPLFSAALVGLAIGALIAGPFGDRIGRKRILMGSVLFFGICTLASAYADSIMQLTLLRLLTGLGLGAAMPNAVTLLSEYAPVKHRSLLVNFMFCGFTLGASSGGFAAAWIIPAFGWESIFIIGGVVPIVLSLLLFTMPESISFMVAKGRPSSEIARILKRISKDFKESAAGFMVPGHENAGGKAPLSILFSKHFRLGSYLFWLTYFMGLVVYYMLTSWMPTLMREAGFTLKQAAQMTALLSLGAGVGPLILGWLMDRVNAYRVVAISFALAGCFVWIAGYSLTNVGVLPWLIFTTGVFLAGALTSMPVLAASYYPTAARASGVAWMLGIGRFGGVVGAFVGGPLLAAGFSIVHIMALLAIPSFIAGVALFVQSCRTAKKIVLVRPVAH
jgi:AAHS family 4-hydroxybenzoate transporter-like MFS transporter